MLQPHVTLFKFHKALRHPLVSVDHHTKELLSLLLPLRIGTPYKPSITLYLTLQAGTCLCLLTSQKHSSYSEKHGTTSPTAPLSSQLGRCLRLKVFHIRKFIIFVIYKCASNVLFVKPKEFLKYCDLI